MYVEVVINHFILQGSNGIVIEMVNLSDVKVKELATTDGSWWAVHLIMKTETPKV